jgi:hypothetical protein
MTVALGTTERWREKGCSKRRREYLLGQLVIQTCVPFSFNRRVVGDFTYIFSNCLFLFPAYFFTKVRGAYENWQTR